LDRTFRSFNVKIIMCLHNDCRGIQPLRRRINSKKTENIATKNTGCQPSKLPAWFLVSVLAAGVMERKWSRKRNKKRDFYCGLFNDVKLPKVGVRQCANMLLGSCAQYQLCACKLLRLTLYWSEAARGNLRSSTSAIRDG